jgi:protein involved in polysaccharide export with SLBB domain
VRRGGRTAAVLDVYDYLTRGDASRDVRLADGDVVFVPPRLARVRALGRGAAPRHLRGAPGRDARRPAPDGRRRDRPRLATHHRRARAAAGAARAGGSDRVVLTAASALGDVPALPLVNGDVVRIGRVGTARVGNRVTVRGNVVAPGPIGLRPGMLLSDALRTAGLRPDTYLGRVLVTRLERDSSRVQLRAMLRDVNGAVYNDLPLREDDDIEVFSVAAFRADRSVSIGGAVRQPGRYAFRAGMSMRDLVLLAGGLTEGALLTEAEIARLPASRTAASRRAPSGCRSTRRTCSSARRAAPTARVPGRPTAAPARPTCCSSRTTTCSSCASPDFELQRTVFLGGEVRYPGGTPAPQDRAPERGVARPAAHSEGYADGVVFYRTATAPAAWDRPAPRAPDARARDNFVLQDGDSVVVPAYNPVVRVVGAVNAAGAVAFAPGGDVDDYVRAAGGPGPNADLRRVFVQQPNGKVESVRRRRFLPDHVPAVRAGAIVTVPAGSPASQLAGFAQAASILQTVATVVGSIITTYVLVRNLR